jgi:hypothetical protein
LEYEVPLDHLRPSRKQYVAACKVAQGPVDQERMHTFHFSEVVISSACLVVFLLHNVASRKLQVKNSALHFLGILFTMVGFVPVVMEGGENLPVCRARDQATCMHMKRLLESMSAWYGDNWRITHCAHFLWHCTRWPLCVAIRAWAFQIFWQAVELIDTLAASDLLSDDAEGMPVLKKLVRCRRLASALGAQSGLSIRRDGSGELRLVRGGLRSCAELRAEKLLMSKYVFHHAAEFEGQLQLSMCLDCSGVAGHELLTLAVSAPKSGKHVWLPVQVMSFKFVFPHLGKRKTARTHVVITGVRAFFRLLHTRVCLKNSSNATNAQQSGNKVAVKRHFVAMHFFVCCS